MLFLGCSITEIKSNAIVDSDSNDDESNPSTSGTEGFFLITDVPNGMKHFVRTAMETSMDGDFDTGNVRYKARERYSFGVSDPLGIYGSPGSS